MYDKYQKVRERGKPTHKPYDEFSIKHPHMDLTRRAKVFSPFDALKGFNDEISNTELQFETNHYDLEHVIFEECPQERLMKE